MNRNRCIHCLPGIIALLCLSLFACSSDNEEKPSITACKFLLDGEEINRLDFGEEKGSVTLYIVSPTDWKMETTVDWITLSRKTGLPSETGSSMMVHVALNSDIAERQGEIILKAADGEKRLTVTQQGGIDESGWEKASLAVRQMKTGWNLGNTLDPFSNNEEGHNWIELYTPAAPSDYETAWGQPITTPELMVMFKEKGFNAIRIPVTWFPHLDEKGQVKEEWMNRVEEVVNYVLDAGMYCVLNVHHDTGADPVTTWLMADMDKIDQIESKFASLWKQIAERFNRYDQKLLFESFNEMLDNHYRWEVPANTKNYEALNRLAQTFVNTVRATGDNNAYRNLIINTYSANHKLQTINAFKLPDDHIKGHLIASVHSYDPWHWEGTGEWTTKEENEVIAIMERLNERFTKQGIPLIIGEYAKTIEGNGNASERAKYAACVVGTAKRYNMACFHWMGLVDRKNLTWEDPEVVDAIVGLFAE